MLNAKTTPAGNHTLQMPMARPCLRCGMMDATAAGPTTDMRPMPTPSMKRVASIMGALVAKAPSTDPRSKLIAVMVKLFFAPSFVKIPPAGNARTTPISENIDITHPMVALVKPSSGVNSVANSGGALNWQNAAKIPIRNTDAKIVHLCPMEKSALFESLIKPPCKQIVYFVACAPIRVAKRMSPTSG